MAGGRRPAAASNQGITGQSDLNGIPLSAIERIEVLPTSASGIYGAGATGGVINIILRRDYTGGELNITYQNTFDTDAARRRVDLSTGFTLNHGKTQVMLTASYSDGNSVLSQDRDFVARGRAAITANNLTYYDSIATFLPLGSTPNIRSVNRSNLVLKNGTALNSSFTYVPVGYAGTAADGGAALVANAGKYNLTPADSPQSGIAQWGYSRKIELLRVPTIKSASLNLRHRFFEALEGFIEVSATDNLTAGRTSNGSLLSPITLPATAPNNPFTTAIRVQVPDDSILAAQEVTQQNWRVAAGLIAKLPRGWMGEADVTWSRARQEYFRPGEISAAGRAALIAGAPDIIRDTIAFPLNLPASLYNPYETLTLIPPVVESLDAALRVSGPLATLPAGALTLSSVVQHREDKLPDTVTGRSTIAIFSPSKSQSGQGVYAEVSIPVVGDKIKWPLVQEFTLQVAVRHDRFTANGSNGSLGIPFGTTTPTTVIARQSRKTTSTNPTVGLRYRPVKDLALRVSYNTGFNPPTVFQLISNNPSTTAGTVGADPRRGNQTVVTFTQTGGNPNLDPEETASTSAGLVFTPSQVSGLRMSADYTRIKKTNYITRPTFQQLIDNEASFPDRITRGANLPGDLPGWAGPITLINGTLLNASGGELEAIDFQVDYEREFGRLGTVQVFASATRTLSYSTQILPTSPVLKNVGYGVVSSNPSNTASSAKLKVNGGVTWQKARWSAGWSFTYVSAYLNYAPSDIAVTSGPKILNQGNGTGRIPSQTYHDVFVKYRFLGHAGTDLTSRWLGGVELRAGIRNIFNTEPPLDFGNNGYFYSYHGDPRLANYYVSLKKSW